MPVPLQKIRKMRAKSHIICFLQRSPSGNEENQGTLAQIPHLFFKKSCLRRVGYECCLSFPTRVGPPQAWTRARWLMRANTGMLQITASAVAIVVEHCWAALSCHAEASSSAQEPAALDLRAQLQGLASAAGAPAQSLHGSQLPGLLSQLQRGHQRQPAKAPVPRQSLVSLVSSTLPFPGCPSLPCSTLSPQIAEPILLQAISGLVSSPNSTCLLNPGSGLSLQIT